MGLRKGFAWESLKDDEQAWMMVFVMGCLMENAMAGSREQQTAGALDSLMVSEKDRRKDHVMAIAQVPWMEYAMAWQKDCSMALKKAGLTGFSKDWKTVIPTDESLVRPMA